MPGSQLVNWMAEDKKDQLLSAVGSMRRIEVAPEPDSNVVKFAGGLRGHSRPTLSELRESFVIPGFEWVLDDEGFAVMRSVN